MSEPRSLIAITEATRMLNEAKTLDDVRSIRDLAEAARVYARAHALGLEAMNHAAEVKLRAERKAGELLRRTAEAGERQGQGDNQTYQRDTSAPPTLADLGISRVQSSRWQAIAEVEPAVFEEYLADAKANAQAITTSGALARRATQDGALRSSAARLTLPDGKFRVLLADPPWQYDFAHDATRAIENQYGTLDVLDIASYTDPEGRRIADVATENAVLFMWATAPKLREALLVLDAWGFEYVTHFVWVKDRIGMGYWARSQHELLLIGRRGRFSPPAEEHRRSSVFDGRRSAHSVKPSLHEWIEAAFPGGGYLELFARSGRSGWAAFGNEAPEEAA